MTARWQDLNKALRELLRHLSGTDDKTPFVWPADQKPWHCQKFFFTCTAPEIR